MNQLPWQLKFVLKRFYVIKLWGYVYFVVEMRREKNIISFLNKYDIILKAYKSEVYKISKLYKKHLYKIKDSK